MAVSMKTAPIELTLKERNTMRLLIRIHVKNHRVSPVAYDDLKEIFNKLAPSSPPVESL